MGVQGLSSVISGKTVALEEFRGRACAIDAMGEIFKSQAGIQAAGLTNKAGIETGYLNVIFSLILRLAALQIKQIWVFEYDIRRGRADEHRKMKRHELARRSENREKAKQRLDELKVNEEQLNEALASMNDEEKKTFLASVPDIEREKLMMEQRLTMVNSQKIDTVKKLLDLLGVQWMEAPITYEAEHLCAALNIAGVVEWVYSADIDTVVHGAPCTVRKEGKGPTAKYICYMLENILMSLKITRPELTCIAICLGTDYHERVDGKIVKPLHIGPGTVLQKYKTVDYQPYAHIYQHFMRECDISKIVPHNANREITSESCESAIKFLVEIYDFNHSRLNNLVHKHLGFFKKMESTIKRKPPKPGSKADLAAKKASEKLNSLPTISMDTMNELMKQFGVQ